MAKRSPAAVSSRIRRHWAGRAPVVVVVAGLLGIGAAQLVLEDPAPRAVATWEPKRTSTETVDPTRHTSIPVKPPAKPTRKTGKRAQVAPVVSAAPHDRLRALKELERSNPAAAAATAARLVNDPEELVRLNAVAVLARSQTPEAARALAALDPASQRLAAALRERR